MNLPNVYGQGAMFAFSGLDGETDYNHDFVGSLLGDRIGILFHLKVRREFSFELQPYIRDVKYNTVALDVLDAILRSSKGGEYRLQMVFANAGTIIGKTSAAFPVVRMESGAQYHEEENLWTQDSPGEYTALAVSRQEDEITFAFAFSPDSSKDAVRQAQSGLAMDIEHVVKQRVGFFQALPSCPKAEPLKERAYYKAFSVLKANIMTGEGQIKDLWTTPDRIPHRNMWLWDSVFHSIGLKYISPQLAYRSVEAVLDGQRDDGFVPHMITPHGCSGITQPPILAWGIWRVYEETGDRRMLENTYEPLKKYIAWDLANRDENHNYLCEWFIEGNVNSRSGESGMDNSPRFDNARKMDAVDFSAFLANDVDCLKKMAQVLEYMEEEAYWDQLYTRMKDSINTLLWDEKDGIYYDRDMDGHFNGVKAESCFMPMFAGIAEKWQAEKLVEHLRNPEEFWTPFPVPSAALSEPEYSTDMWRGSVWINYNYMIVSGLKRYGYHHLAAELTQKTLDTIAHWYGETGSLFEFYDSLDKRSPFYLDRKGPCTPPYDLHRKIYPIRDYGWTAAVYIAMMLEE